MQHCWDCLFMVLVQFQLFEAFIFDERSSITSVECILQNINYCVYLFILELKVTRYREWGGMKALDKFLE